MNTTAVPDSGGTRATLAALAVALVAFALTAGVRILEPTNVAWLLASDDQAEAYLGWQFYREMAPDRIPATSDHYGLELGTGLFYSDVIPLVAIPLKQVGDWLPHPFQYTGWWILACFVLQAYFASKLLGMLPLTTLQRTCAVVLFVFAPPLLFRIGWHNDLAAHWLLLAGLYLYFGSVRRYAALKWIALLVAAALIHSYLFAMCGALWCADLMRRRFVAHRPLALLAAEGAAAMGLCIGALWCAGFFTIGKGHIETGFGYYKMNVLSPVDSNGWSFLLPNIPEGGGDYEGFNYLGFGLLALTVLALYGMFRDRAWRSLPRSAWPLVIVLSLLSAYAISNVVTVGPHDVEIPLPGFVMTVANLLRSSGRMFWPVFYAAAFAVLALLAVRHAGRPALTYLLIVAAVLQVVDTSPGWWPRREKFAPFGPGVESPLRASFWDEAGRRYQKLRVVPLERWTPDWRALTYYAAEHGMGTDAARLSRVDLDTFNRAVARADQAVRTGDYAADSLYVLDPASAVLARTSLRPGDLLREIDGFTVLAPRFCANTPDHMLCTGPVASRAAAN